MLYIWMYRLTSGGGLSSRPKIVDSVTLGLVLDCSRLLAAVRFPMPGAPSFSYMNSVNTLLDPAARRAAFHWFRSLDR